ncbi:hypothetical protein Msub_20996 [Marinobacter subterrani]|uniref:Uncharacterized protein n=1 Tax=Marinobacter subterrani TaxID=1658765 RepID=A0A0J7LY06_9GAMM|nr:hypothetical protein Msub_20996 [Marinobacter subterrani]
MDAGVYGSAVALILAIWVGVSGNRKAWRPAVGILELLIGAAIAVLGALGYAFKKRATLRRPPARRKPDGRTQPGGQRCPGQRTQAMARTGKRQREQRTKPDTQKRDDLEGHW